jgi:molybdate transport system substrate-binding protein
VRTRTRALCVAAFAFASLSADAAEVHVMISGGFAAAFDELVPAYEKASGNTVVTARGPSMGETPQAIPNRLARGEVADVVIMVDAGLDRLIAMHLAVAGSRVDLANATIWMAVKAGAPKPDISTVDAFVRTLDAAKSIAYSDSASGVYLEQTLFPKLDPDNHFRAKGHMIPAEPVGRVRARRGRDRLPAAQRTDADRGHHDRRTDPGRAAEGDHVRRGNRIEREGAGRGSRPGAFPDVEGRAAGDHQERHGAGQRDHDEAAAGERTEASAAGCGDDERAGTGHALIVEARWPPGRIDHPVDAHRPPAMDHRPFQWPRDDDSLD